MVVKSLVYALKMLPFIKTVEVEEGAASERVHLTFFLVQVAEPAANRCSCGHLHLDVRPRPPASLRHSTLALFTEVFFHYSLIHERSREKEVRGERSRRFDPSVHILPQTTTMLWLQLTHFSVVRQPKQTSGAAAGNTVTAANCRESQEH